MANIHTYIINLKTSRKRRSYMNALLSEYQFLNIEFIDAIDGRLMTNEELSKIFDYNKSFKKYGRVLNNGEIGCTLSHRACYNKLLGSAYNYALVLEDDISIVNDIANINIAKIQPLLDKKKPCIILLSGDYWYYNNDGIVKVYSAVGSYAYLINKEAAKRIIDSGIPFNVADDWRLYKELGVLLYAIKPYLIDANVQMDILGTDIQQESWGINRHNMPTKEVLKSILDSLIKKVLNWIGHFESKIRVINNKVINE